MLELKAGLENMKLYGFISCHETFFFQFEKCEAVEQAKKMMGMMPPQMLQTSEAQDCPCRPHHAVINTETTSLWGFPTPETEAHRRQSFGGTSQEGQGMVVGELDIPGRKCW